MTAAPDGRIEPCPPDRLDYFATADRLLVGEIPADGSCTRVTALERRLLQRVWDGDSEKPALVERARAICLRCPALDACHRYATENLVQDGFLAGMTATQRRATWTRRDRIARRRRVIRALYEGGAAVADMVEVLEIPRRTIEADIATLGLSGSRRRNLAS
jgi:hypothetical protein